MSDDARDVFYYEMLQRAGLVRVEAPDGTVWWVSPELSCCERTTMRKIEMQTDGTIINVWCYSMEGSVWIRDHRKDKQFHNLENALAYAGDWLAGQAWLSTGR